MRRHFLLLLVLVYLSLVACGRVEPAPEVTEAPESIDYAASLPLDMSSDSVKLAATVTTFVDGDTVHFSTEDGIIKARFLAIDTPESTGKVEPYGKKASAYTQEVLSAASAIYIESDTAQWNLDSTGSRYLCWVWYLPQNTDSYRNLNIELLQLGLANGSNAAHNRYGDICTAAIAQAQAEKQNLYSGEPDPDYRYGDPLELTIRELRTTPETYSGEKVAVSGIIIGNSGNNGVYVESVDSETGLSYGIFVYYGFNLPAQALDALKVGNECRIVGTFQFYEAGQSWQISGLSYRMMEPDHPENVQMLSEGNSPAYPLTDPAIFAGTTSEGLPYAQARLSTSISMEDLTVCQISGTVLQCQSAGTEVMVRLSQLPEDLAIGATIAVKGIVECHEETYQIHVFSPENITIY